MVGAIVLPPSVSQRRHLDRARCAGIAKLELDISEVRLASIVTVDAGNFHARSSHERDAIVCKSERAAASSSSLIVWGMRG